ncbi:MAG: radical SAM protein [bacterium]
MIRSSLYLGKNVLLSNINRLSFPYKLTFAVTSNCNSHCSACNIWQKKEKDELSLEEIDIFFKKNRFSWVNLTGGEPLLRKDFVDIIYSIWKRNPNLFFLNFTSNGLQPAKIYKQTRKILSFLSIPKFAVGISIDGYPGLDEKIKGRKGSYKRALGSFLNLKRLFKGSGYQPFLSYTILPENIGCLQETIKSLSSRVSNFKLKELNLNLFHFSPHYYNNLNYDLSLDFFQGAIKEVKNYLRIEDKKNNLGLDNWLKKRYLKLLIKFIQGHKSPLPCQALKASCYIDPLGNVYPCAMYNKKIGNIRESNYQLITIWNSKEAEEAREKIKNYHCPQCWTACEAYQTILGNFIKSQLL